MRRRYLDDATRDFLLKAKIPLTGKHRLRAMNTKLYLGEKINGFSLEKALDIGVGHAVSVAVRARARIAARRSPKRI